MLKGLLKGALVAGGAPDLIRAKKGSRLRILMYHRFQGNGWERRLSRQLEHVGRYYSPISLTDACTTILKGRRLAANALAVTVDDGYTDFEEAWQLFRKFDVPVTLFVVSRFAAGEIWLWPDVVLWCVSRSRMAQAIIPFPGGATFTHGLADAAERAAADSALDAMLIAAPDSVRRQVIGDLPGLLDVSLPAAPPAGFAGLTWDRLRAMAKDGLDVGAHTRTHPLLARLNEPGAVRDEVAGSKLEIEEAIDCAVDHFCYPNGMAADYDEVSCGAVQEAGFLSAVTAVRGLNAPGAKRFELMRVGVGPEMPLATFELEVAGFRMP